MSLHFISLQPVTFKHTYQLTYRYKLITANPQNVYHYRFAPCFALPAVCPAPAPLACTRRQPHNIPKSNKPRVHTPQMPPESPAYDSAKCPT